MIVRPFADRDAPMVAELHRLALPRGFLSTLGDRFLARLYRLLARADRTCVWVGADPDDRCVGFVAGSLDIGRAYRQVLSRGALPLAAAMLPGALRPAVLGRALQTLAYPLRRGDRRRTGDGVDPAAIRAELLSIAVADRARGHGLGRRLVAALEASFREWGHRAAYRVVTDAEDPRSNAFYAALGFARAGEFHHHDHRMALYTKNLSATRGTAGEEAS
jgi:ribosomal protein S18 acetylase RimI-like enzyme